MVELENRNSNGSAASLSGSQSSTGPGVGQVGRDLKHQAQNKAEDAKEQIRSMAEMGKDRVADKLDHVARALRGAGENLQSEDQDLSQYADVLGDKVEQASRFLRDHQAIDLADGIERVARRQPWLYLGGAFVAGLAIGRFLKSSAPERPALEEGYAMGGYDVQYGYAEREQSVVSPPVVTTPTTTVGSTPGSFVPPSGTFRGTTGGNNNPTE